jgi:aldose 1-epimerase
MSKLKKFTLQNSKGMQVELCNFGARILSIRVPNDLGKLIETTLNHATDEAIVNDGFYMGATVGRTSNRISNSIMLRSSRLSRRHQSFGTSARYSAARKRVSQVRHLSIYE